MFNAIRRVFAGSPNRTETPDSPRRRSGQRPENLTNAALRPRHGGNAGAAPSAPPRAPNRVRAALAALVGSPRHHAAPRHQSSAPLPVAQHVAQEVAQWLQAAEQDLPNMRADYGQYALGAADPRPNCLRAVADLVTGAAQQRSPTLKIQYLPAAGLPQSIGRLYDLKELTITNTECTTLPESIGDLTKLTTLDLTANNHVKRLPESISKLAQLTTLLAQGTPLEALPQEIGNLSRLSVLRLNFGRYEHLPQGFTRLSALKELQLSNPSRQGPLQALPDDFGQLSALEKLDLTNQQGLRTLPDSLTRLQQLQELNLADCSNLTELPSHLEGLRNLKTLSLRRNVELSRLPESMRNLHRLEQLDLSGCTKLQALPVYLGELRQLKKLNLTGCTGLRELPASLELLPRNCEILVPLHLQEQFHRMRSPRNRVGQRAAGRGEAAARPAIRLGPVGVQAPARPPRPVHEPRPAADGLAQMEAWKQRLAPFRQEDGALRFAQWMDAILRRARGQLTPQQSKQMASIVQAASEPGAEAQTLRAKLNTFATENVHMERDRATGETMVLRQPTASAHVLDAYEVYLSHMMSAAAPGKAYELLSSAARELFGHMDRHEAILHLAGSTPQGRRNWRAQRAWPVLEAYVLARDEQGKVLAEQSGAELQALSDAAVEGRIKEDEMLARTREAEENHRTRLYERCLELARKLAPPSAPILNPARR